MTRPPAPRLITDPPPRLRQRQRADGTWRLWWEPEAAVRALGHEPVELSAARLTWSVREAKRLNALVDASRDGGPRGGVPGGRTVDALIIAYRSSPRWQALRPATRVSYLKCFDLIGRKWGGAQVEHFTKPVVVEWHETLYTAAGPTQALALVRCLSLLFSYATRKGWRVDNPCLQIGATTPPPRHRVASWAELEALLAAADALDQPAIGAAIAIAVFMGQRQTDIIEANWADLSDGRWFLIRSKRGNRASLVLHPEVLPWLARIAPPAGVERIPLLVNPTTGHRWKGDNFRHRFAAVRARAAETCPGIRDLQFRDLRRTFGHLARSMGRGSVTPRDVGDALGNSAWKDPRISGTYMPEESGAADHAILAIRRPEPKQKPTGTEDET